MLDATVVDVICSGVFTVELKNSHRLTAVIAPADGCAANCAAGERVCVRLCPADMSKGIIERRPTTPQKTQRALK